MAAMVAAAAFELVDAAVPEAVLDEPPEVGAAVVALLLEVAVKLVGSMVPQLLLRFWVQTLWPAWLFWLARMQSS